MSDTATNGINMLDPLGLWKTARDANLDAWAKMMNIVVNSDEYAQTTGAALEQSLAASQPFRDSLAKVKTQMQGMMNMPTRSEVISLAERLINLELRLDDMDAKLSAVQAAIEESTRDAVRQALATPTRHLRTLETRFDALDARFDAMPKAVQEAVRKAMTPEPPPAPRAPKEKAQEAQS